MAVVYFPQPSPSIANIDKAVNRYYCLVAKGANGTVKFDVIYFIGDGKIIKTYKIK